MAEISDLVDTVMRVLWFNLLSFSPLILGYAAWGWFTDRGLFGRTRVAKVTARAYAIVGQALEGWIALANSPGALATIRVGRPILPYACAGAIGLLIFLIFPVLALLTLGAWGLWATRGYDRVLVILVIATAVLAAKDLAILIIFVTFGLGIPLLFVGTALAYGVCARGAVRAWSGPPSRRIPAIAFSAMAAITVAVLPASVARMQAHFGVQSYRAHDHVPTQPLALNSLEIRRYANSFDGTFEDGNGCGPECRSVFDAGHLKWVRVVMLNENGRDKQQRSTVYTHLATDDCGAAVGNRPVAESCVVVTDDVGTTADLVVTMDRPRPIAAGRFDVVKWRTIQSATATRFVDGTSAEILHLTGFGVDFPVVPSIITSKMNGMSSEGIELMRWQDSSYKISLRGTLASLGLVPIGKPVNAPAPRRRTWQDGIDAGMSRAVTAVLDLSQPENFNVDQARVIVDWLSAARTMKEWPPDQRALLRRIVLDRRLRMPTDFDQIFERNPEITRAFLPDVLDLLETHGISSDLTTERKAAYTFTRIDPALLAPQARRILDLIDKDQQLRAILLPSVGRLGVDPSSYLKPFTQDIAGERSARSNGYLRVRAACLAEIQWASTLNPGLRDAVEANALAAKPDRRFESATLKALANLGDIDFVSQYLAQRPDQESARLAQQIQKQLINPLRKNGLC